MNYPVKKRRKPRKDFRPDNPSEVWFLRQQLGWTQQRLADYLAVQGAHYRLACSTRAISYFESLDSGRKPPAVLISLIRRAAGGSR